MGSLQGSLQDRYSELLQNPLISVFLQLFRFRSLYENDGVVGLEISAISVEDEGEYKCVAFNTHGKTETKCELLVNGMNTVVFPLFDQPLHLQS